MVSERRLILFAFALIGVLALVLYSFGQPTICTCGYVKVWEGVVLSSGNSQHLTDWYTFSHIIHGFLFYLVLTIAAPRLSLGTRLLLALGAEVSWEAVENPPWLIEPYRQQALAQGYIGDSIINSISDTVAMIAGFFLAWRLPVLATVAIGVALELFVGASIRDNLTLNVLGFFHQFKFIRIWQSGGQ